MMPYVIRSSVRTNAATGTRRDSSDTIIDAASSRLATIKFAKPPVKTVDFARRATVAPWSKPAMPPPAMNEIVHYKDGGTSVIREADAIVPAMMLTGDAIASMTLSSQGT